MENAAERIVLVGMMGSGKSSVGHALAARTGWPFVDNDELLERTTGRTARDIAEADGEPGLRVAEGTALREALALPPPTIVAAAAGTVLDPALREEMTGAGLVVWLRAPVELLAVRAGEGEDRPWVTGDARAWLEPALAAREALYADVAELQIDTAAHRPGEAVDRVLAALAERGDR